MTYEEQYLASVAEALNFLRALGSVVGLLGLICGLLLLMLRHEHITHNPAITLIIISFMLVAICGLHTGTRYFGLYR